MKKYLYELKGIILIKVIADTFYIIPIAMIPLVIKRLFDYDFSKGSHEVILLIGIYFLIAIIGMVFQYISQLYAWKFEKNFNLLIKRDIFDSILRYDYRKFNENSVSYYISILNNDVSVAFKYIDSMVSIIQSSIQVIVYGIFMFLLDSRIAIVIIISSILTLFLPNITEKTLSSRRKEHLEWVSLYIGKVKDLLEGFKNVSLETEENISKEHYKSLAKTEDKLLHYGRFSTFTNIFNGFFMYLLDISAFIVVAILLLQRKISVGTASGGLAYIKEFVYPIRYIIGDITNMKSAKSIKNNLLNFINYNRVDLEDIHDFKNKIEFKNVSIKFDDFEIKNFDFDFKKGKKYAIIGHSGSGKSTILNLLMKYLSAESGNIYVDGRDIKDINITKVITCLNQFEHIFQDDFINNVSIYGSYNISNMKEIINYYQCEKISLMTNKKDCTELSGGEKQLLSLVKVLLMDKEVLLLDEPFSALDFHNTILVNEKLYDIKDKTLIVVTHNLSENNLKHFDELILMDNGIIKKKGIPKEVISSYEYSKLTSGL